MKGGTRGTFVERLRARRLGPQPQAFAGQKLPLAVSERPSSLHGIGVDILRLERIQKIVDRSGTALADKILGEAERAEFDANKNPVRYLAMAFAAKEAFAKAYGTGFRGELGFSDAGVLRESNGRPHLVFSPKLQALLAGQGIIKGHVSLSDEGGMICAMVVLESA